MFTKTLKRFFALSLILIVGAASESNACTGIMLKSKDGGHVLARTCEWGTFIMESKYVVFPRGHVMAGETPSGAPGMNLVAKYGYVGICALEQNYVFEAVNEKGMAAEMFYFPGYGKYAEYNPACNSRTILDTQLVSWIVGNFATISEMEKAINNIQIAPIGRGFETGHWSIADATGREVVLELIDGKPKIWENKIGVITNAPTFDWHMTNLNNYCNVFAGAASKRDLGNGVVLKPIGVGSAAHGLPGDLTPPSRFVRAAFYVHTAADAATSTDAVFEAFQILNNFDIPIGTEFSNREEIPNMMSATQWTSAIDLKNTKFYYRTEWDSRVRCIDLKKIDFEKVKHQMAPLDEQMIHQYDLIEIQ